MLHTLFRTPVSLTCSLAEYAKEAQCYGRLEDSLTCSDVDEDIIAGGICEVVTQCSTISANIAD